MSTTANDITKQTAGIIKDIVADVAANPLTDVSRADIAPLTQKLTNELAPMIINAANAEPFYQSRLFWGTLIAGVGTIIKPITGDLFDSVQIEMWTDSLTTLAQFAGLGIIVYTRFFAPKTQKPLGS